MDRWDAAAARLAGETLLPCAEVAKLSPAVRGARCRGDTLTRWILRGKDGVYLDGVRATWRGWHTSREAWTRFWAELSRRCESRAGRRERAAGPSDASRAEQEGAAALREEVRRRLAMRGKQRVRGTMPTISFPGTPVRAAECL